LVAVQRRSGRLLALVQTQQDPASYFLAQNHSEAEWVG